MYPQAVFLHGISNGVTCLRWSCTPAARRLKTSTQTWLRSCFFCSNSLWLFPHRSARLCGKNIPMWPSASTRQELPHTLPEDSTLTLELSLSLLSHVHTDTHTYTSIMTHLHLPTSAVSHRSNSPCCHRPLLVVASSCWLTTNKNISLLVCLLNRVWSLERLLRWFLCQKWCSPLKKEERSSRWGSSSLSWGLTWEQHGEGRLMARSSWIQCPGGGGVCIFSL